MSNFLSKIGIKSATDSHTKLDLSCDHYTTHSLFTTRPVYYRVLAPGQSIDINHSFMCRTAPLYRPLFGNLRVVNRAFFVPFHTVMASFENMITNTPYNVNGSTVFPSSAPYCYNDDFKQLFVNKFNTVGLVTISSSGVPDIHSTASNGTEQNYRFTNKGRSFYTILLSLGININFFYSDDSANAEKMKKEKIGLLPLLCYLKIKADWYTAAQYGDNANIINQFISRFVGGGYCNILDSPYFARIGDVIDLLTASLYDQDFFTSVWDKPLSPTTTTGGQLNTSIYDPTAGAAEILKVDNTTSGNGTPVTSAISSSKDRPRITQYLLNSLRSLTNFVTRRNLVGARDLDRYLAEYGVQSKELLSHRSIYLGDDSSTIQISDVTSNVNNDSTISGELAGKGVGFSQRGHFSYKASDHGVVIIITSVLPKIGYYQMLDHQLISPLDFYTPEFDSLGTEPVRQSEVYHCTGTDPTPGSSSTNFMVPADYSSDGIFGFMPRYHYFKTSHDFLSGDMRILSRRAEYQYYHMLRDLWTNPDDVCSHGHPILTNGQSQFNRVFNYQGTDYDPIFAVHHFEVHSNAPFKSLYGAIPLDGGETINMSIGGTQLN